MAMTSPPQVATQQPASVRPFGWRDKIGYAFGDLGNDMTFMIQAFFFLVYFTRVIGIDPAHVGALLLGARIIDAFTDIGVGRLVDTIRPARDGKFKPWIRRMAIPVALASALMFQSFIVDWGYGARLAWMIGFYFLWGSIFYTSINIPYGSMASVISDKSEERATLSVWRSTGAQVAFLSVSTFLPPFVFQAPRSTPAGSAWPRSSWRRPPSCSTRCCISTSKSASRWRRRSPVSARASASS